MIDTDLGERLLAATEAMLSGMKRHAPVGPVAESIITDELKTAFRAIQAEDESAMRESLGRVRELVEEIDCLGGKAA